MDNTLPETANYTSVKKLIILSLIFFIVPFLGLIFLKTQYDISALYKYKVLHTVSVLTMSTLALLVAFLGYTIYSDSSDMRIMFIIFAFFTFGAIFFLHAMSLPSLRMASKDFFELTEHYSLFFVSLLVFIGASLPANAPGSAVHNNRWYIFATIQIIILLFFIISFSVPKVAEMLTQTKGVPDIFTAILFIGSIVRLLQQYALDHNEFIISIILGISVILNALAISPTHREWDIEWWYLHFILALSFAVASLGILMRLLKKNR